MTKEEMKQKAGEYAEGMAKYYESAHDFIPSQFEKYLRNAVEYGYNKAREELLEQAKNYIAETASGTAEEMGDREQFYIAGLLDGYAKGKDEMKDKLETAF